MKLSIANNLRIDNPTPAFTEFVHSHFIIPNPDFDKKQRLGYSTYRTPRFLHFYAMDGSSYILPYGVLSEVLRFDFEDCYIDKHIRDFNGHELHNNIELWTYQMDAMVHSAQVGNGIIVMPSGSGKTQVALSLICKLGGRALWITHTLDLLHQSKSRAETYIPNADIGVISGGRIRIGENITFATVQTLANIDLSQYQNTWDIIIVDECHRICGTPAKITMFYKVIDKLCAKHKYGLTATPYRNLKGTELAMLLLLGGIIIEVEQSDVDTMKACIQPVNTGWVITQQCCKYDGTIDYTKMVTAMTQNPSRNSLIVSLLRQNQDHNCIVLSDRVEHLYTLRNMLGQGRVITGKMSSKSGKLERIQAIEDMRSGKERFLFATYQLVKEGLDIPVLDRAFLTVSHSDKATIVQSVGRIERSSPEKGTPICYDFIDDNSFHHNQWKRRKTIYRQNGNIILEVQPIYAQ